MADLETVHATIDHTGVTGVGSTAFVGVSAERTTNQALTNGAYPAAAIFNAADDWDTDAFHNPAGGNPSRCTCPSGKDGYYLITGKAQYSGSTGERYTYIMKNGAEIPPGQQRTNAQSSTGITVHTAVAVIGLAAGDYIELGVYCDANSVNLTAATLQLTKVG